MEVQDFQKRLEEAFGKYLEQMNKEEFVLAEKGDERLRFMVYRTKGQKGFPLEKVCVMVLENGWVWNKDDKNLLDKDELIVGSFIAPDDIPLPILAVEASLHFDKYDHLNVDAFPLSKDERYREIFCEPLKALREKNRTLPGLLAGARTPELLGPYTSGGMLAGDFAVPLRDKTLPLWFEYVDAYKGFLDNFETYSVLKEPTVIEEAKKMKATFLAAFRHDSPRILSDIPHLYTEENGKKLGELMF